MIVEMMKLRVFGPQSLLEPTLAVLQDLGVVHVARSTAPAVQPPRLAARTERTLRYLRSALEDADWIAALSAVPSSRTTGSDVLALPAAAHWLRRLRRRLQQLALQRGALDEEQALIGRYRPFFAAFQSLLEGERDWVNATPFHVLLRAQQADEVGRLRDALSTLFHDEFELRTHTLSTGEVALLLVVPATHAAQVERMLVEAGIQDIPLPAEYVGRSFGDAVPAMLARYDAIPAELAKIERERATLLGESQPDIERVRRVLHDCVTRHETAQLAGSSGRAFVLEGWAPARARPRIAQALQPLGETVVLEELSREQWGSEDVPVVLHNPAILRPFELLIRLFPLPRYGTIDPTPFVAVFFPMFFGLITGDIGYGLVFGGLGLLLMLRSKPDSVVHSVARILLACALFAVVFGFVFGEFFGNLGERWFNLHPLWFNREHALMPFLILAVSLGGVHILIGLVLGVISNAREHPRAALGRGITALMIVLLALALLAAAEVLPRSFFNPAVIALLVAFPLLVIAEGIIAPIEFLSTVGNILSYARVMALGTASVIMATVANRMAGALGSVLVGVLFALLFHVVNFALGLFSPTIHALRLHYVEFFGKFFSPGGVEYHPFGHWTPGPGPGSAAH